MKKLLTAFLCTIMVLGLAACGSPAESSSGNSASTPSEGSSTPSSNEAITPPSSEATAPNNSDTAPSAEASKTLVVYFSLPETTKSEGLTTDEENSIVVIDGEVLGNTQYLAYLTQENTGADIFRIEPKTPYPTEHEALVNLAKEEQNKNARPELAANVDNLDQYDTIFVGYPNWWGDMPMILYTFFDANDFSGKTIIPFNTHGGSGFSGTIGTIAELEPDATVDEEGFTVSRNTVHECADDVKAWIETLNLAN